MENSEIIEKAMSYVNSRYGENGMTIEDVAVHAGFSTNYFNRIFLAHTGFSVMEYVRFTRLKRAAQRLRCTDTDILNIALECGYDSHESFTRAFKKQYDLSPSEYRKKYEHIQAYYGDFYNDTLGPRLIHEFPDYKVADTDEVIDYLLEKDAVRLGYSAVTCRVNGGVALYKSDDFRDGFIWFTEWEDRAARYEGEILGENMDIISTYLSDFSDDRFDMVHRTASDPAFLGDHLRKVDGCLTVYTDEPYNTVPPNGFTVRELKYEDFDIIKGLYTNELGYSKDHPYFEFLKKELYRRDVLGNEDNSTFLFGILSGEKLVGYAEGGLQSVHGFTVNNCIYIKLLDGYKREDLAEFTYKFVTNAAIDKGALPIDDVLTPYDRERVGLDTAFNSTDMGYRTVAYSCKLK